MLVIVLVIVIVVILVVGPQNRLARMLDPEGGLRRYLYAYICV